jgi:hypothetical protein
MTPADLVKLLLEHLPTIRGIAAVSGWEERPHGLQVTLDGGGSTYWMVTGATRVAPAAGPDERLDPQPLPDLSGHKTPVAAVEQALLAAIAVGDTGRRIVRADRYSARPVPSAVGYGANLDCADQSRLFVTLVATARQGEQPRQQRYYSPDAEV